MSFIIAFLYMLNICLLSFAIDKVKVALDTIAIMAQKQKRFSGWKPAGEPFLYLGYLYLYRC